MQVIIFCQNCRISTANIVKFVCQKTFSDIELPLQSLERSWSFSYARKGVTDFIRFYTSRRIYLNMRPRWIDELFLTSAYLPGKVRYLRNCIFLEYDPMMQFLLSTCTVSDLPQVILAFSMTRIIILMTVN